MCLSPIFLSSFSGRKSRSKKVRRENGQARNAPFNSRENWIHGGVKAEASRSRDGAR